jgi:predicted MFS family arabinose efflux permease
LAPVVGGWLIEHVSWRAVFFLNVPLAGLVLVLSARFMEESRDPSRSRAIDWAGGVLAVLGLGGVVFGLIEAARFGASRPLIVATVAGGAACLALLVFVEHRATSPMLPLTLFRSRTFTLANLYTLVLYAAVGIVFFLVPLNLIQVQHYSATEAGASLLPVPVILFILSRWSGGLVARVGSRLPLTAGPILVAIGLALFAESGMAGSYWTTFFPAATVLGFGMVLVVAPLTATVMGAVERQHAGVASGVNNAVARVAALLAIAVFGVVLVRTFDSRVRQGLDVLDLTPAARAAIDGELPKMAGADLESAPIDPPQRAAVRQAIDEAAVSAFRLVMIAASALTLTAAAMGAAIRQEAGERTYTEARTSTPSSRGSMA